MLQAVENWLAAHQATILLVQTVASVAVMMATLWYVVLTQGILKQSHRVEAARNAQQQRAQASLVAAWVGSAQVTSRQADVVILMLNTSPQPVYTMTCTIYDAQAGSLGVKVERPILPPGARVEKQLRVPALPQTASGDLRTIVSFTDASGERWHRDQTGQLSIEVPIVDVPD